MKFQKIICLLMLIFGALAVLLSFVWQTGGFAALGEWVDPKTKMSLFIAAKGKNDATLYNDVQGFNTAMMYCGIAMVILAVILYITACNKRRNYYVSNYVATGLCAGGNIVMSLILMIMNGIWLGKFQNLDFASWKATDKMEYVDFDMASKYNDSKAWFIVAFVVYILIIAVSVMLILNLVWKIKLMNGEKRLLNGQTVNKSEEPLEGGATAEEVAQ